jgi:hypothetical protein
MGSCLHNVISLLLVVTWATWSVGCHLIYPFDLQGTGPSADGPSGDGPGTDGVTTLDSGGDTVVDPLKPFGPAAPVSGTINTAQKEDDPYLTADMLEIYFERADKVHHSKRSSVSDPWPDAPVADLTGIKQLSTHCPKLSHDELELYVTVWIDPNRQELYHSTRSSPGAPWSIFQAVAELNSSWDDFCAVTTSDGQTVYFSSGRTGNVGKDDLWFSTRAGTTDPWSPPQNLAALNTAEDDKNTWINGAGTVIYFYSGRAGGSGGYDIWAATGPGDGSFGAAQPLGKEINTPDDEEDPWLSPDLRTIVFTRKVNNNYDIYMATR